MAERGGAGPTGVPPTVWIDDEDQLHRLIHRLTGIERYALDTEFHRERTYYPKLALLQFATATEVALVDPLAVDVRALAAVFAGPAEAVLHAAQQDLDVLQHACGAAPANLYDTQLAAGFLGYGTPSLSALVHGELRITVAKGDRLTDWLHRPLTPAQQAYAAADVAHLLQLRDVIDRQLGALGRQAWAYEAVAELRSRQSAGSAPEDAWTRLKDARSLKPRGRGVARAVAAWRERRAMAVDQPVRQILPDLAVLGIAQKVPTSIGELARCRGVDERHTRGSIGRELLEAVAAGSADDVAVPATEGEDLDRHLRPAVTLVSAWIADLARRQRIDTSLLATRADLIALLRGEPGARLADGWRSELIGDGVQRLLAGAAALTFDGERGLRLIDCNAP